jgi:hypothetical protein
MLPHDSRAENGPWQNSWQVEADAAQSRPHKRDLGVKMTAWEADWDCTWIIQPRVVGEST